MTEPTTEPLSRIFLSHASEDKQRVLQIYARLATDLPWISSWIDIFEITGGDSLIDKIAVGMDNADKFFVFLSPVAVTKPWVQAELKRALNHEITGVKPGFIVPIKFGELDKVPAFLEDKRYIDLDQLTVAEWVAEFRAAIEGKVRAKTVASHSNIAVETVQYPDPGSEHIGQVQFSVASWAEEISFQVATKTPAVTISHGMNGPGVIKGGARNFAEMIQQDRVGFALPGLRLSPGQVFWITITFPEGETFSENIAGANFWDGSGATMNGTVFQR